VEIELGQAELFTASALINECFKRFPPLLRLGAISFSR